MLISFLFPSLAASLSLHSFLSFLVDHSVVSVSRLLAAARSLARLLGLCSPVEHSPQKAATGTSE